MKNLKKIVVSGMIFVLILSNIPVSAATPKINKTKATIYTGDTTQLSIKNTKAKVKWESSNKKVATVNAKGVVKGIKAGKATITGLVNKKKYKCKITVKKDNSYKIGVAKVEHFSFEKDSLDGIKVYWKGYNNTGKTIYYYTVNFKIYNAVGDPVYDEITGKNTVSVEVVGPVYNYHDLIILNTIGYFPTCSEVEITSIDLVYSDRTTEHINFQETTTVDELVIRP